MSFPYTPYPITTYLSSPLWQLSPVASNISSGWVPSCTSSNCVPTASWSTGAVNSSLTYMFYAWDLILNGTIEGDMKLQVIRNGKEETLNPSGDSLFTVHGLPTDQLLHQNLTITVLEASTGARLTINQAHLNASSYDTRQWSIPSNDGAIQYTGFTQQQAAEGLVSPTTYVSSAAGDKMTMQFNSSAMTIYGPCGPSSGLMRVKIDSRLDETINITKPIQSDDCLLFQSSGLPADFLHSLEVENVSGGTIAVNRMEFFRIVTFTNPRGYKNAGMIAGIVLGVLLGIAGLVILYSTRSRKVRQKINNSWKIFCG
ncbi:unnamed protein product [Rhizoctonia solani]|uniref:Uncharacterized protein n=1 Tax=Rhizoctonia solani TaxID=456999 RepID=A0A8H3B8G6_9AGAM|nr:unnamed protein product [Rhizoctonia solani]